jgi:hypothetical protein
VCTHENKQSELVLTREESIKSAPHIQSTCLVTSRLSTDETLPDSALEFRRTETTNSASEQSYIQASNVAHFPENIPIVDQLASQLADRVSR